MWQEYRTKRVSDVDMWTAAVAFQKGLKESDLDRYATTIDFEQRTFAPMRCLVSMHKDEGLEVWIVSASQRALVEQALDAWDPARTRDCRHAGSRARSIHW